MYTAFSYSRIKDFEICPRQFHETAIRKSVSKPASPQMEEGKRVHKALEVRVRDGRALPSDMARLEGLAGALSRAPGEKLCELQMAIDNNYTPVGWFDKTVYSRAVADLVIDAGPRAALFDYKTGRKTEDYLQLRLTAAHYFHWAPGVDRIDCAFIWTMDGSSTPITVLRSEVPAVWKEIAPRIEAYQEAFRSGNFPATPSWACKNCPVKSCEHNPVYTRRLSA